MKLSRKHFWHLLLYFFNKKKIAASVIETYGEFSPSIKT